MTKVIILNTILAIGQPIKRCFMFSSSVSLKIHPFSLMFILLGHVSCRDNLPGHFPKKKSFNLSCILNSHNFFQYLASNGVFLLGLRQMDLEYFSCRFTIKCVSNLPFTLYNWILHDNFQDTSWVIVDIYSRFWL